MRNISFEFGPVVHELSFKDTLSLVLVAILFGGAESFVQFWSRTLC